MTLIILVLPLIGVMIHDLVRRPTIRRLALRNLVRRRGEALLVIAGSLLGTAIITASFIVGDTLSASFRDFARTELGPTDEVASVNDVTLLPRLAGAIGTDVPGTDGVLTMVTTSTPVSTVEARPRAEPRVEMIELDFDAGRRFGNDPGATGLERAGPTPAPGQAVIGRQLANELDVEAGEQIVVHAYGQRRQLAVRQVLPRRGLAGWGVENLFVAPGTIAELAAAGAVTGTAAQPPSGLVLVSNDGGVYDGAKNSAVVERDLRQRVTGISGVDVQPVKQDLLDDAEDEGSSFTQLFASMGAFSVIAGILLLVNIFVMLAEERKSELGMLRAVGLKRNQLVRTFGLEGGIYAVVSSLVGAVVGIGVGWVVVILAQGVFNEGDGFDLVFRFSAEPSSLLTGLGIGGVIAMFTVWGASTRIGRLNVIRAIRDVPEPVLQRQRVRTVVFGTLGVAVGGLLLHSGLRGDSWFGALAGVPVAAASAIPLLVRFFPRRAVVTVCSAVALVWPVVSFDILEDAFRDADIPLFVVQGVLLVGAAVALLATNADLLVRTTGWLSGSGRTLSARLAFAYPLARRFRTSMLLGMYALIIFTMSFMAVFMNLFQKQAPRETEDTRAGYDIVLDSNRANPASPDVLSAQPDVVAVAPILRGWPQFSTADHPEPEYLPIAGFDERFLARGRPKLTDARLRVDGVELSDADTWRRVLADDNLAVVSEFFLQQENGPPQGDTHAGDTITIHNRSTGQERDLVVAGVVTTDWIFNGVFVNARFARDFMGTDAVPNRTYVAVRPGADPQVVAERLNSTLIANGADGDSIEKIVKDNVSRQQGFFRLLAGFIGLGLLIGIAGLGVVMVRAVRERRRQIGMLRAMGFQHGVVRMAFILEAAFVAVQGALVGVVLALIVSYYLMTQSDALGNTHTNFAVPWLSLAALVLAALVASMIAVLSPARQASRIKPAVALRIAD